MSMDKDLPQRKSMRLRNYDYSSTGVYFVTICIKDRSPILSEIVRTARPSTAESNTPAVGEGLAPPVESNRPAVGEGLAPPAYLVKLKPCGTIAKEQLQLIEKRFPNVSVKDYIIMPDHIHVIVYLRKETGGASPSPTLNDVVCAFKSLTSRICKQQYGIESMFQRSYAEHIVRDREDYETRRKYISENPMRWYYKNLHTEK